MCAWSECMRPSARPGKPPKVWPRLPKSARGTGTQARPDFRENRSATPANAVQALVDRAVFLSHLPQRIQRRRVVGRFGFALRGELGLLSLVTGFPLGLRLDEPALLHGRGGRSADQEAKHNGYKDVQPRR